MPTSLDPPQAVLPKTRPRTGGNDQKHRRSWCTHGTYGTHVHTDHTDETLNIPTHQRTYGPILSPCGVGATAVSASSREKKVPIAPPLPRGLSALLVASASVWWLQKVWKPSGGAHLGHVFRGQAFV